MYFKDPNLFFSTRLVTKNSILTSPFFFPQKQQLSTLQLMFSEFTYISLKNMHIFLLGFSVIDVIN